MILKPLRILSTHIHVTNTPKTIIELFELLSGFVTANFFSMYESEYFTPRKTNPMLTKSLRIISVVPSRDAPKNLSTKYPASNPKNGNMIVVCSMWCVTTLAADFSFLIGLL
ncbi:MAG: hypothetical protein WBG65_14255 [Sulfurimonadaceae bacterium]